MKDEELKQPEKKMPNQIKIQTLQKKLNRLCLGLDSRPDKDESKIEQQVSGKLLGKRRRELENSLVKIQEEESDLIRRLTDLRH